MRLSAGAIHHAVGTSLRLSVGAGRLSAWLAHLAVRTGLTTGTLTTGRLCAWTWLLPARTSLGLSALALTAWLDGPARSLAARSTHCGSGVATVIIIVGDVGRLISVTACGAGMVAAALG